MTAKTQLNIRISDASSEKLDRLTEIYGTQTTVIEIAIDRMARDLDNIQDTLAAQQSLEELLRRNA